MPKKFFISSVEGGEDELDPRRLVVKGSGSTYVAGGKIEGLLRPMIRAAELLGVSAQTPLSRELAGRLFPGLPRAGTFTEIFVAIARIANVFNNFPAGMSLWRPADVTATVLAVRPDLDAEKLQKLVLSPGIDPETDSEILRPQTVGDYFALLRRAIEVADHYEPFMEKSFELWKKTAASKA